MVPDAGAGAPPPREVAGAESVAPLLRVEDLRIAFRSGRSYVHAVNRVTLEVGPGEIVGLIGQSGSGKTTLVMGLMGLLRGSPGVWHGKARLGSRDLLPDLKPFVRVADGRISKRYIPFLRAQRAVLRGCLGREMAAIFQEPKASLDPYFTVGEHLLEALARHPETAGSDPKATGLEALADVELPDPESVWTLYPHEISGGMAQRVMIAMALCASPKLLIADEPSTSLDVTTQAKLLQLFTRLREKRGLSILLISHDMGVIQQACARVYVMHRGAVVECGPTAQVLRAPRHPYTASLVTAYSRFGQSQEPPPARPEEGRGCAYRIHCAAYRELDEESRFLCEQAKPVLQAEYGPGRESDFVRCHFPEQSKLSLPSEKAEVPRKPAAEAAVVFAAEGVGKTFRRGGRAFQALQGIHLQVREGETYGLVGESGSGKSTLGLALMALQRADGGRILYRGEDLYAYGTKELRDWRREVRMLFQHPEGVLNSGMTVEKILAEGLRPEDRRGPEERRAAIHQALDMVRLDRSAAERYPSNLSSGEKQRVTIARALITRPKVLVCDEPVASLDLAIQSQILSLLRGFQEQLGLTLLFISHNLDMVKLLADRIGVMYMGRLVEEAPVDRFSFAQVLHPYTRLLLASAPTLEDGGRAAVLAEYPDVEPQRLEKGCPFRNRCPLYLRDRLAACENEDPPLRSHGKGISAACHALEATA